MMPNFYNNTIKIDALKLSENPADDFKELISLFEDKEIERYFYQSDTGNGIGLPSANWATILHENKQFEDLNNSADKIEWLQRLKSKYLKEIVSEKPAKIWKIIQSLSPKDEIIQAHLLDAMALLPDELLKQTVDTVSAYIKLHDYNIWSWTGEPATEIMQRLAHIDDECFDKALIIANLMLPIHEERKTDYFKKAKGTLQPHDYNKFLEKHYVELCKINQLKATKLLLKTLDNYLRSKESDSEDADNSFEFQISTENLDSIDSEIRSISSEPQFALLQSICNAIKQIATSSNKPEIESLLDVLDRRQEIIFKRLRLYTLKYTKEDAFKEKYNTIISNFDNFDNYLIHNEYDSLFYDKFNFIDQNHKTEYLGWIENLKITKNEIKSHEYWLRERNESITQNEVDKAANCFINGLKARKLHPLKDHFKEEYNKYSSASEWDEKTIKPHPSFSVGGEGWIGQTEGSPITEDELSKMPVADVLIFLQNGDNYSNENTKNKSIFQTPEQGLAGVFGKVVNVNYSDYLKANIDEIFKLPLSFLRTYFHGLRDCLNTPECEVFDWNRYFEISQQAIKKLSTDEMGNYDYSILKSIAWSIQSPWQHRSFAIEPDDAKIQVLLSLYKSLMHVRVREEDKDEILGRNDPVQDACNEVNSIALESLISFAVHIKSKREDIEYDTVILPDLIDACEFVLNELQLDYALAVFGKRLTQLFYSNEVWFKKNHNTLLYKDGKLNLIWNTYLKWARPYKELFDFLIEKGVYQNAIIALKDNKEDITDEEEKPATHLGKHLVIAYFHDWLKDDGALLNSFYEKASVPLRKATNHFFTTGFPDKNDSEPFETEQTERIIKHWEKRLSYFNAVEDKALAKQEVASLVEWIKSCPIQDSKALGLLSKTLDYTDGTLSRDIAHYVPEFIIGNICNKGIGNELLALECLLKFSKDSRLGNYSRTYNKELFPFVKHVIALESNHPDLHEIREKTCELLDDYGRAGIYSTKEYYFEIKDQIETAKHKQQD